MTISKNFGTEGVELYAFRARGATERGERASALHELKRAAESLELAMIEEVAHLRAEGQSWAVIGDLVGVSKQAAQQRFGKHVAAYALDLSPAVKS